jgi:hypothetical protein
MGEENLHKKMKNNIFHLQTSHSEFCLAFSFTLNFFSLGDVHKNIFFTKSDFLNYTKAKYDLLRMTHGNNILNNIKLKKT